MAMRACVEGGRGRASWRRGMRKRRVRGWEITRPRSRGRGATGKGEGEGYGVVLRRHCRAEDQHEVHRRFQVRRN